MEDKKSSTFTVDNKQVVIVLVVIALMVASFFLGEAVKGHNKNRSTNGYSFNGFGGQGGYSNANRAFGAVSAISPTSISVDDSRTGTVKTFNITSTTSITNNGASVDVSTITTGTNVVISGDSSNNAVRIIVNPNFPTN